MCAGWEPRATPLWGFTFGALGASAAIAVYPGRRYELRVTGAAEAMLRRSGAALGPSATSAAPLRFVADVGTVYVAVSAACTVTLCEEG